MFLWMYISTNLLRLSSVRVDLSHVFKIRSYLNVLSAVAVEIGNTKVASIGCEHLGRSAHWQREGLHLLSDEVCEHIYFPLHAVDVKYQADIDRS